MNSFLIHVDTQTANKINGNPFNCTYVLSKKHRNLVEVSLKNLQMPVGFYNVRSPYNTITINGTNYTITPGNYSDATFVSVLNSTVTPAIGVFSINPTTGRFQFVSASGSATITVPSGTATNVPSLTNLLGFTNGQVGTSIIATYSYILNFDTYVNVYIRNLSVSSSETQLVTFKVPVNAASGQILHWNENSQDYQCVPVVYTVETIDRFIIQVYDRFGNPMDNNGIDWSFSLQIKSDT